MSEEKKHTEKKESKPVAHAPKHTEKAETNTADKKHEHKVEKASEKKAEHKEDHKAEKKETKATEKKDDKKQEHKETKKEDKKPKVSKKDEAVAHGSGVTMSLKHAMYICSFIKHKSIDNAIKDLEDVRLMKRAVPFKGEIPHRKGKRMMSGRYPIKAAGQFINLLKGLKGNALVNGLELEKVRITTATASWASRPMRRGGREQGKRTNVILKCREVVGGKK